MTCRQPGCIVTAPDLKTMEAHYDSKHSKINWGLEKAYYESQLADAKAAIAQDKYTDKKKANNNKKKKGYKK